MKFEENVLYIFKGFSSEFMAQFSIPMLYDDANGGACFLNYDRDYEDSLINALMMADSAPKRMTYEQFLLATGAESILKRKKLVLIHNNLYPKHYPVTKSIDRQLFVGLYDHLNSYDEDYNAFEDNEAKECIQKIMRYISNVQVVGDNIFASYVDKDHLCDETIGYYPEGVFTVDVMEYGDNTDINISNIDDVSSMLFLIEYVLHNDNKVIGIYLLDTNSTNINCIYAMSGFLKSNRLYKLTSKIEKKEVFRKEIKKILKDIWCYDDFKNLKVYSNPDYSNEVKEISQGELIEDVIVQCECCLRGDKFNDIFITAPTGSGKSVIFQIPALYMADKFRLVTIVISPLIALMKDQINSLKNRNVNNAAYINSELTIIERDELRENIKNNLIDIIYLAPESLLSNSIANIIGDRRIGLVIIDESHIVATWGRNFRPDYWYLGKYLNSVRKRNNEFPICTFTATSVYGGKYNDMFFETIESLYLQNVKVYLGITRRDNIKFKINIVSKEQISYSGYRGQKGGLLHDHILKNILGNIKTIIYFPFVSIVEQTKTEFDAKYCLHRDKVGLYHGRMSPVAKNHDEREFRQNRTCVLLATKAFGMGIDLPDIKEIYHYAPTGNLNDYVQEIGRAGRGSEEGVAATDYFGNDFSFINRLYGMNEIYQSEVIGVLRKLYSIYLLNNEKRNFLVKPEHFISVFPRMREDDDDGLQNKVKTVLLMIEKDFEKKYSFPVIITRPKSIFSKVYFKIDKSAKNRLEKSRYFKYFTFVGVTDVKFTANNASIMESGNVYIVDLKRMWEDEFHDRTFALFKKELLNKEIDSSKVDIIRDVHLMYKVKICSNHNICEIPKLLKGYTDSVTEIISQLLGTKKTFKVTSFKELLSKRFSEEVAGNILQAYFGIIDVHSNSLNGRHHFYSINADEDVITFRYDRYRQAIRDLIANSLILGRLGQIEGKKCEFFISKQNDNFSMVRIFCLIEIFGLGEYDILGGEEPEIFVRFNDPYKIRQIVNNHQRYENKILETVKRRHHLSVQVMTKFFVELRTDNQRWDMIEDYFLGKNVLDIKYEPKEFIFDDKFEREHVDEIKGTDIAHLLDSDDCGYCVIDE